MHRDGMLLMTDYHKKVPDHTLATLVRPLQVRTGVHSTMRSACQWIQDIMTPLVNNQCNTQSI